MDEQVQYDKNYSQVKYGDLIFWHFSRETRTYSYYMSLGDGYYYIEKSFLI